MTLEILTRVFRAIFSAINKRAATISCRIHSRRYGARLVGCNRLPEMFGIGHILSEIVHSLLSETHFRRFKTRFYGLASYLFYKY